MLSPIQLQDICTRCGACCAHFRVSFYWAEGEAFAESLQEKISPTFSCMQGTNQAEPRCVALTGTIGECVSCSIYPARSSTCKSVEPGDAHCDKARAAYGLIAVREIAIPDGVNDDEYEQVS